jgi:phage terminase Nu1 subunit (DNA packaging protein)
VTTEELLTQDDFADRLGLSTRQVRNLEKSGLPTRSRGGKKLYPWGGCLAWYISFKVQTAVTAASPADFDEAKTRKMAAEAEIAELDLAIKRQQLITQDDHRREMVTWVEPIAAALRAFPGRHATQLTDLSTPGEVEMVLQKGINEIMEQVQRLDPEPVAHAA